MRAKFCLFLALLLSTSVSLSAQNSRQYIKERIGEGELPQCGHYHEWRATSP